MRIRLTPTYLLAFVCLAFILGIGHELAHHVAGFLICGEWGYKTFNSFRLAAGCRQKHPDMYWLATLVGPLIGNYIPIWVAFARMRRPDVVRVARVAPQGDRRRDQERGEQGEAVGLHGDDPRDGPKRVRPDEGTLRSYFPGECRSGQGAGLPDPILGSRRSAADAPRAVADGPW